MISRAVNDRIALFFAALVVDHRDDAVAVHGDQFALLLANGLDADVLDETVGLGVLRGLLADPGRRTADVERTHGELRAGLADGLRRDHADRFAALHQPSGRQVAAVAQLTQTPRFDSQVSTERILTRSIPAA